MAAHQTRIKPKLLSCPCRPHKISPQPISSTSCPSSCSLWAFPASSSNGSSSSEPQALCTCSSPTLIFFFLQMIIWVAPCHHSRLNSNTTCWITPCLYLKYSSCMFQPHFISFTALATYLYIFVYCFSPLLKWKLHENRDPVKFITVSPVPETVPRIW